MPIRREASAAKPSLALRLNRLHGNLRHGDVTQRRNKQSGLSTQHGSIRPMLLADTSGMGRCGCEEGAKQQQKCRKYATLFRDINECCSCFTSAAAR
ncbi:hypothetical protein [Ottowia thiooxydans]|uniref:hypothetical protein n=1 Tax=Ottowia thiooxydans TaxID=219182 RepID=UPI0012EB5E27|nr:hypothetical protein [Ottowia thiooxydans]